MRSSAQLGSAALVGQGSINILLVDDEARNLDVLESVLASPDYGLVRAQSAQEALMALMDDEFAALVLDIQMPGASGIELAQLIKQRKRTRDIPIIFLTAFCQDDRDVLQGYEVGAVDYLTKPIDPHILRSKIGFFVELFQKSRDLSAINQDLEREIVRRQEAEEALRQANHELETRVRERTAELTRTNEELRLSISAMRESENRYRQLAAIVESSCDAIISKDLEGLITSWNGGAERLFGYQAQEMIGRPITILLPAERTDEDKSILQRIRRGERLEHYETIRRRKDGGLVEVSLTVSPIKDARGSIIGASKIGRDITRQKQAERELERAHQEILAASRAKDDFLATLSHELRAPLNPVLLLTSEGAEDTQLPAEVRAQFAAIRNGVELEARLIDDLLDLTRITHGKLLLNLGLVNVHALLNEALVAVQAEFDEKRICLSMNLAGVRCTVMGDAVRLQQVLWNVLKNAVKFTPAGGRISVETRTATETGELIITVADNGIGMTTEELARIFEPFAQGEHAQGGGAHQFGGLGLGLAISRMLVRSHAGTLGARSEGRNRGSTFIITLPLVMEGTEVEPSREGDGGPPRVHGNGRVGPIQILLVEDHEPTRAALAHLLTRRRYEVKTAASVAEARTCSARQDFHLLISDIGLPDGNGCELLRELRAVHAGLRGIALTGYGTEEDIARSQAAGFANHLIKPIRVQALETALEAALEG